MAWRRRTITIAAVASGTVALILVGVLAWSWPRLFPSPLERGRAAYARRDWPRAEALARDLLKKNPDNRDALRLLAWTSGRMGRDETSRAIYARLGPEPSGAEDCLVMAADYHRRGDAGSAIRLLEKGLKLDPDHADILHFLVTYDTSMDRLGRAEELAGRLAGLPGQGARGALLLGDIRGRLSDPVGAAEALERALRLDPTLDGLDPNPRQARKLLARDYLKAGKPALARPHLRQVLEANPDPEASWLLSRARLQERHPGDAASALGRAGRYGAEHLIDPEPSPYVGSGQCASCHEEIHRAQQSSRHARTFWAGAELARMPLPVGAVPDPADPKAIDHRARLDGDRVDWETRVGGKSATATLRYAFGSGDRGITPVALDEAGRFLEIRLSRYGDLDGWDVTTGHPAKPGSPTAEGALGLPLGVDELRNCLGCHTTDFRAARDRVGPTSKEAGIGCERCHGPGGNHLEAASLGFPDPAIARPKKASAEQVTRLCAECHGGPGTRTIRPDDPNAVRFQGTTLTWSRCYQESRGGMGCVTCHDPHHDAGRSASNYEAKCLACHPAGADRGGPDSGDLPTLAGKVRGAVCPVNPAGECVKCHMPATKSGFPHTTFTDHHIRVHRPPAPTR